MSRVFLKPNQDTSIYEVYPTLNTGYDEILEIGKNNGDDLDLNLGAVRSLIQFDLTDLKGAPTSSRAFLNLKIAHAEFLNQDEAVLVLAVSESWTEGSGYYLQRPYVSSDGATWKSNGSSAWSSSGSSFYAPSLISFDASDIENGEVRVDVTSIIERIITGSADNYGIGLKFTDSSEGDSDNRGNIRFFSRQTHTVHEPTLELVWDDFTFTTGSLRTIPNINVKIAPSNLDAKYTYGEKALIRYAVRDKFPPKTYSNRSRFENQYYLPSGSSFSITDAQSGTTIIPFDQWSAIDCDSTGSYMILDTDPLYKGRSYDIQLKIPVGSQIIYTKKFRFGVE